MVRATGIESNGGADEDIAIDTPAMSAAVIGDIIDTLAGVLSCSREVIELAVMTLVAGGHLLPSDLTGAACIRRPPVRSISIRDRCSPISSSPTRSTVRIAARHAGGHG